MNKKKIYKKTYEITPWTIFSQAKVTKTLPKDQNQEECHENLYEIEELVRFFDDLFKKLSSEGKHFLTYGGNYEESYIAVISERDETDSEYSKRINQEKLQKEFQLNALKIKKDKELKEREEKIKKLQREIEELNNE